MRVIITGVAGLLGARMAEWILLNKPDVRVVGIDDLSEAFETLCIRALNLLKKIWQELNWTQHISEE